MSWITLTVTDLRHRLSPREIDIIARAVGSFDDASTQAALDDAADMARGYLRANARNRIDRTPHSIPRSLKADVLAITVVDAWAGVAGVLPDPKGIRKAAADAAIRRLEAAAASTFAVEQPDPELVEDGSVAVANPPSSYIKDIQASRQKQRGVL